MENKWFESHALYITWFYVEQMQSNRKTRKTCIY